MMYKYLFKNTSFTILVVIFLVGCNANTEQSATNISDVVFEKEQESTIDRTVHTLDNGMEYSGFIVDKYKYTEQSEEYYVLITEFKSFEGEEVDINSTDWEVPPPIDYSEVCAIIYKNDSEKLIPYDNLCFQLNENQRTVEYLDRTFEAKDSDGDGENEWYWMYHLVPENDEPSELYLEFFYKKRAYLLKGALPVYLSQINKMAYLKEESEGFSDLSDTVKEFAYRKWDAFVDDYRKNIAEITN